MKGKDSATFFSFAGVVCWWLSAIRKWQWPNLNDGGCFYGVYLSLNIKYFLFQKCSFYEGVLICI